jgi:hypothetical protein
VEQSAAEQVGPVNLGLWILGSEGRFDSGIRRPQPECPVRAVGVVVLEVDLQHLLKVAAADAQQPVQAFGTDRADPSVRRRRRRWRWVPAPAGRASSALRPEHVVEGAREPRVAVAQDKRSRRSRSPSTTQQVAGPPGDSTAVGVGGHPGQMDPAGVQFNEQQHLQPPQPDRVDGEAGRRPRSRPSAGAGMLARSWPSAVAPGPVHDGQGWCGLRWPRPAP